MWASADSGDRLINFWRIGSALGASVDPSIESPAITAVRDLIAQGSPVLLTLSLQADDAPAIGHAVVATGIAADGAILIHDHSPALARSSLSDYLSGFPAGGRLWKASIAGALRLMPRVPSTTSGFLLASFWQKASSLAPLRMEAVSPDGVCGPTLDIPDSASTVSRFRYCDGAQSAYQLHLAGTPGYRVMLLDLATGGRSQELAGGELSAYRIARPGIQLNLSPQTTSFETTGVVNAATFARGIAPGGLFAIFGNGLTGPGGDTSVDFDGQAARVVSGSPFQVNAQVPPDIAPGIHLLRVRSHYGSASQTTDVVESAPVIFVLSRAGDRPQGAIVNQDGRINSPRTPVRRGQALTIYGTGFGAVAPSGSII